MNSALPDSSGRINALAADTNGRFAPPIDVSRDTNGRVARAEADPNRRVRDTNGRMGRESQGGYRRQSKIDYGGYETLLPSPTTPMTATTLPLPASARVSSSSSCPLPPRTAKNKRSGPIASDSPYVEPPAFASAPLGPFCDYRSLARAPLAGVSSTAPFVRVENSAGEHGWSFRHASGHVESPLYPANQAPLVRTAHVLDVYVGLLIELTRAGLPADGRVRIGRHDFLRLIQWTDENNCPGGAAYDDLDAALSYLFEMRLHSSAIHHFEELAVGLPASGVMTFRILQAYGLVSALAQNGIDEVNRDGAGHRADDLVVWFSAPFVRLLRNVDQRVTYRLSHYLAFKRGGPRALYRYVAYLATQRLTNGGVTVDLDDLFASVGSTLRGVAPAKMRQLFGDALDMLVSMGLLRSAPVYSVRRAANGRRHQVTLFPSTPPSGELKDLLIETLVAWKVTRTVASKFVEATPDWAATVVAATTLGMLVSRKDLPSMVVDYLKNPGRELDRELLPRFNPTRVEHQLTPTVRPEMRYLQERYAHSGLALLGLSEDDKAHLEKTYAAVNRPQWVVDGLVLSAVHRHRHGATLDQYLASKGGLLS